MIKYLFVLSAFYLGVALAGVVTPSACESANNFDLQEVTVPGCSGTERCEFVRGQTYEFTITGCSIGRVGDAISSVDFVVNAPLLSLLGVQINYQVDQRNLCPYFTRDNNVEGCDPAVILPACGTFRFTITAPGILPVLVPAIGLDITLEAKAWVNGETGLPVACFRLPAKYIVLV